MKPKELRAIFYSLTKEYFEEANVFLARQSRIPKPKSPLVLLSFGAVMRPTKPNNLVFDGVNVGQYASSVQLDVDLFTHGAPVEDSNGSIIAHENTAVEDLCAFDDYLQSQYVLNWSDIHSVAIVRDGDVQDLSGIVGETSYEYRARMRLILYFTSLAIEHAAVSGEDSIVYPTGRFSGGEEIFEPGAPVRKTSTTGGFGSLEEDKEKRAKIVPQFKQTDSKGGTEILVQFSTGYFTEAEIEFVPYQEDGDYATHGFAVRGHLDETARSLLNYLEGLGFYPITADFDPGHSVVYVNDNDLIVETDDDERTIIIYRGSRGGS